MRPAFFLLAAVVFLAGTARAQTPPNEDFDLGRRKFPKETRRAPVEKDTPEFIRWMLQPLRQGMLIRLPVVDTDPNRGVTAGVMPIWVFKEANGDRIEQIHAPSLTYNKNFGVTPTYRYYYYPEPDAALEARSSIGKYEKEAMAEYNDASFLGSKSDFGARVQYNVDAGQRFFGLGPNSPKRAESNYKDDDWNVRLRGGLPLWRDAPVKAHLGDRFLTKRISDGPLPGLPGFSTAFPGVGTATHQQTNEMRLTLDYDTRDHAITTSKGAFVQAYSEYAVRSFLSSFNYSRYGVDAREFLPWGRFDTTTALRAKYEQLLGDAPFWLKPSLGGKYNLRAYGDGRYVDRAMAVASVEQRFIVHREKMAGVTTEFEVAPFFELGEAFDNPGRLARRYARPVVGSAVRAVARPQVVGSIDFGVGQEGMSAFMDINYSF
ncbi:MAG TPA: BamA/TamA family outer membrane protein [Elusimicrobiota bacterium]|nr:BamA/TamA family outer membrane protein [Elusimicrobiota bacterium]